MNGPFTTADPADERLDAIVKSAVWTLIGALSAGLLATGLSVNGQPFGFMLLLAAVVVGLFPLARWKIRSFNDQRLTVAHFPEELASILAKASASTTRLHALAQAAEPGPVQEHLEFLAIAADLEIRDSYENFDANTTSHFPVELTTQSSSLLDDLAELELAAVSLLETQRNCVDLEAQGYGTYASHELPTLTAQTHELRRQLATVTQNEPTVGD